MLNHCQIEIVVCRIGTGQTESRPFSDGVDELREHGVVPCPRFVPIVGYKCLLPFRQRTLVRRSGSAPFFVA